MRDEKESKLKQNNNKKKTVQSFNRSI